MRAARLYRSHGPTASRTFRVRSTASAGGVGTRSLNKPVAAAHPEVLDRLHPRTASNYRMSIRSYKAAKETARGLGMDVSGR